MFAAVARRAYRWLLVLYPPEFRQEFAADLVLAYDDLVRDRGMLAATSRTSLDLIVTIPRYQLEAAMTTSHADRILGTVVTGLPMVGISAVLMGNPWVGGGLIAAGIALFTI